MSKKIEIIASDLDGTLLNSSKKISPFSEETLIDFEKKGKTVVLASGRFEREVINYAKQLKLDEYGGFMVCANGYEVHDFKTNKVHTFDAIEAEEAQKIVRFANAMNIIQYIRIDGVFHLNLKKGQKFLLNQAKKLLEFAQSKGFEKGSYTTHLLNETKIIDDLIPELNVPVYKICFISTPKKLERFIQIIEKNFPDYYSFYYVNPVSVEITRNTVSKKNAVEYIARQLGYTLDNVIAFGDSGNDEPLLMNAKIGITMKNGTKKALAKAKIISEYSNDEDGVAMNCLKYLNDDQHIQMVMVDLDGTLLTNDKKVSQKTIETLAKCRDKNVLFGIATGRSLISVQNLIKEWGIADSVDVLVGFNGAHVIDFTDNTETKFNPIDTITLRKIYDAYIDLPASVMLYKDHSIHTTHENDISRRLANNNHFTHETFNPDELFTEPQLKMLIGCDSLEVTDLVEETAKKLNLESVYQVRTQKDLYEFMDNRNSKSSGIDFLAKKHGFTLENVMAFGDENNDVEMLRDCGCGVAMANASESAKNAANEILEFTNEEDGVARRIEKLLSVK